MPKIDAANWIPVREDLETDSRVLAIAESITHQNRHYVLGPVSTDLLGDAGAVTRDVMRDVTIVALLRVWAAFTHHTRDGSIHHATTIAHLDTIARLRGFGQAMAAVGWAVHDPESRTITLPNFTEYNAPNKNGQRAKTAAAERQARYREKQKGILQTLEADAAILRDMETSPPPSPVTLQPVTSDVTRDVTPSISNSLSSSVSESGKEGESREETPAPPEFDFDALKRRINALRPQSWGKAPHWSAEDETALYAARQNFGVLDDQDWLLLTWFFKWANSAANTGQKDPVKVTTRRHQFVTELPAYLDRATTAWKQNGCPKLGPKTPVPKSPANQAPGTKHQEPPTPPAPNSPLALLLAETALLRGKTPPPAQDAA